MSDVPKCVMLTKLSMFQHVGGLQKCTMPIVIPTIIASVGLSIT